MESATPSHVQKELDGSASYSNIRNFEVLVVLVKLFEVASVTSTEERMPTKDNKIIEFCRIMHRSTFCSGQVDCERVECNFYPNPEVMFFFYGHRQIKHNVICYVIFVVELSNRYQL